MLNEREDWHTTWETYIRGQVLTTPASQVIHFLMSFFGKSSASVKVEDHAEPSDLEVEIPRVALNPGRILNV